MTKQVGESTTVGISRWMAGGGLGGLGGAMMFLPMAAQGEDQISYRHETYLENDGRMRVGTESVRAEKSLTSWMDLKVTMVYDAISGATPSGAPPVDSITLHPTGTGLTVPGTQITGFRKYGSADAVSGASRATGSQIKHRDDVPLADSSDIRRAVDVSSTITMDQSRLTPQFTYSGENDYLSYAGAINYALDLNDKNTTLNVGWAHTYDLILSNSFTFLQHDQFRNTDDFLLGVSQLLGPKTVLAVSGTVGFSDGYQTDPYRGVVFDGSFPSSAGSGSVTLYGEKRPDYREKQAITFSLTQGISSLDASIEGSYRYYHDSYDIQAHTVGLTWNQKVGSLLVISPSVRYYRQSAASFYDTEFAGDPATDPGRVPHYYSSDYRLSYM